MARIEDVWDYVFEFSVLIPCAREWGRVVFSFGVEGDMWCGGVIGGVGGAVEGCG